MDVRMLQYGLEKECTNDTDFSDVSENEVEGISYVDAGMYATF